MDLEPRCSAKGCRAAAVWQLRWNNPKIHAPEYRMKKNAAIGTFTMLTTPLVSLPSNIGVRKETDRRWRDFLDVRGFLREVSPFPSSSDAPIS